MTSKLTDVSTPWASRAHNEVSGLRRAITAELGEPLVNSAAAPMMGELLTRLEEFSKPEANIGMKPPIPPCAHPDPSQAEASALLHDACEALRERVLTGSDDRRTATNLRAMVQVIENHLEMKSEVVARSTGGVILG